MSLSIEADARYRHIESLLVGDVKPPAFVVELGSAPGDQIARLARLGYRCTSVDIGDSSDVWAQATEGRMKSLLADAGVQDITWNLEHVPYPLDDSGFDAVVMTEVYEHLRDYPIRALREVCRILRPGGRLYFTTPNQAYLINRIRLLAGRNVQSTLSDWIAGVPFARHAREYTFIEVHQLIAEAGMTVVKSHSRHFHVHAGRGGSVAVAGKMTLDLLARLRPSLGPQIVIVAEKPKGT